MTSSTFSPPTGAKIQVQYGSNQRAASSFSASNGPSTLTPKPPLTSFSTDRVMVLPRTNSPELNRTSPFASSTSHANLSEEVRRYQPPVIVVPKEAKATMPEYLKTFLGSGKKTENPPAQFSRGANGDPGVSDVASNEMAVELGSSEAFREEQRHKREDEQRSVFSKALAYLDSAVANIANLGGQGQMSFA
jgi:hypothetical protein